MNLKKEFKRIEDSRRIQDFKSGGEGSLRSSLFNRTDEAITDEMVEMFNTEFQKQGYESGCDGGEWKDSGKQVMQVYFKIPKSVKVGNVEALLATADYNKNTQTFWALYRPKNGKWSQAKKRDKKLGAR